MIISGPSHIYSNNNSGNTTPVSSIYIFYLKILIPLVIEVQIKDYLLMIKRQLH